MAINPNIVPSTTADAEAEEEEEYFDTSEPSTVSRLAQQHTTEGYRDGITESKQLHVQEGFDEGYILGAALGLKVGEILGVFDGLVGLAARSTIDSITNDDRLEKLKNVRRQAKRELKLELVFGKLYFNDDGIWKWHVEENDGEEATFDEIVLRHPLVVKWMDTAETEAASLGLQLVDFEEQEDEMLKS